MPQFKNNAQRPYFFSMIAAPGKKNSYSFKIPAGFGYRVDEIRICDNGHETGAAGVDIAGVSVALNSICKNLEFQPMPIQSENISAQGGRFGSVTAAKYQGAYMDIADTMQLDVYNAAGGEKIAVIGYLFRAANI